MNTSYNDLYFVLQKDGSGGYLSSNRPGSMYLDEKNKACCNDLFSFSMLKPEMPVDTVATPDDSDTIPVLLVKSPALIIPSAILPIPVEPKLDDYKNLPLYFDNDEPDKRTRKSSTLRSYDETVSAYLERQREYRERFALGLIGNQEDNAVQLIDNFFENEVLGGRDRLNQLCDLMLSRLQMGQMLEVVVKGYTSPRAESDYNLKLAKRRISSVRNHFEKFADGAFQPFLRSEKLKISELSFGETTANAKISDKLSDERNSIYHPDAARERRVEVVEVIIR